LRVAGITPLCSAPPLEKGRERVPVSFSCSAKSCPRNHKDYT